MLEKMNTYLKGLPGLGSFFKNQKRDASSSGLLCVNITPRDVVVAFAKKNSEQMELQWVEAIAFNKTNSIRSILTNIVKRNHLENQACSWILPPSHYQLLLLEALPVSPAEFQSAIRWKIKDMVSFPVADAVIDHFSMPTQQSHDPQKMMMVVVSQASYLQPIVEDIQESGLNLQMIDIQGLGLRNITALYEQDEKSSALIYLEDKSSQLIITREKTLYFSRYLDFGLDSIAVLSTQDAHQYLDKLGLEIQRSFDYYQGQWRLPVPARIFLATSKGTSHRIEEYLSQRLTMSIQLLNLNEVLVSKKELTIEQQGKYLPVIGGLLREELMHDATTS